MQTPIIIEFAGIPNSGKTTLIHSLEATLRSSFNIAHFQEAAELVPSYIPKKTWDRNTWTTFKALQDLVAAKHMDVDIVLMDRSYWDACLWTEYMHTHNMCLTSEYHAMSSILINAKESFGLQPDHLFLIDVDVEESLQRRANQDGLPAPVYSTTDFLTDYKKLMNSYFKDFPKNQIFRIDTTSLTPEMVLQDAKDEILKILKMVKKEN